MLVPEIHTFVQVFLQNTHEAESQQTLVFVAAIEVSSISEIAKQLNPKLGPRNTCIKAEQFVQGGNDHTK